jgi:hypothetical protein
MVGWQETTTAGARAIESQAIKYITRVQELIETLVGVDVPAA